MSDLGAERQWRATSGSAAEVLRLGVAAAGPPLAKLVLAALVLLLLGFLVITRDWQYSVFKTLVLGGLGTGGACVVGYFWARSDIQARYASGALSTSRIDGDSMVLTHRDTSMRLRLSELSLVSADGSWVVLRKHGGLDLVSPRALWPDEVLERLLRA